MATLYLLYLVIFFRNNTGETSITKILLFSAGMLLFLGLLYFLLKRFGHIDAVGKIKNILKGVLNGLQSIRFIKHKGWFVFHSVLIWMLYLASTTIGIYALRESAHLGIGGGLTTLAVGSVGMIVTPGGIGAYPLLVSQLMEVYGIDKATIGTLRLFNNPSYLHLFMKKPVITILQYLFFLGLGILFVWLSVRQIKESDWVQIKTSIQKARLWLIIPVCLTLLLSHFSRAIRWKILMEPLGYKPSTFNTFAAVMIGYLVNAAVPRLGEVVKCTLLSRYEKVRADKLVGTIVMERAVDVVCLAVVFVVALIFQGHVIGDFVSSLFGDFFS